MDSEDPKPENMKTRLERLEEKCEKIPEICETMNRIEQELIGDPYGSRRTFSSRLKKLEQEHPELKEKVEEIEDNQSRIFKTSAGGAGIITVVLNLLKQFFL